MEALTEQFMWSDIIAWALILFLAVLGFKFLMTAGKGLVYAIFMIVIACILYRFFPHYVMPLLDFIAANNGTAVNP